jgi:preprotein translocase subunit SecG
MGSILVHFEIVILVFHFLAAFFLISVILLQAGKGQDIGTMFGAGGSQSLFGARGAATLLSKLTTATAVLFLVTSLSLATIANYAATGGSEESIIADEEPAAVEQAQPERSDESVPSASEDATKPAEAAPAPAPQDGTDQSR